MRVRFACVRRPKPQSSREAAVAAAFYIVQLDQCVCLGDKESAKPDIETQKERNMRNCIRDVEKGGARQKKRDNVQWT